MEPRRRRRRTTNSGGISRLQRAAAAVFSNEDLLVEIFSRVPVKPIVRFKSVCKQWYSLISDPTFSVMHARKNHSCNGLLLRSTLTQHPALSLVPFEGYQPPRVLPFEFLNNQDTDLLHSCKGLLCYSIANLDDSMLTAYYICHLASGKSTRIAVLDVPLVADLRAVNIAFDPLQSVHYKVIFVYEISSALSSRLIKIDTFLSETQSWKPINKVIIVPNGVIFNHKGVYLDSTIYWFDQGEESVWYFDLDEEYVDKMPAPKVPWGPLAFRMSLEYFGESGGNLHIITANRPYGTDFTVYEMQSDKSCWFVKYRGDLDDVAEEFPRMVRGPHYAIGYAYVLLCLLEGETQDDQSSNLVLVVPGKVISYNLKDNSFKQLCDLRPARSFGISALGDGGIITHQYFETLARI
ncbi:hypothetical protein CJ030_MR5G001787 [Morella rubra]|uniref:F-box domain-containing protein n=1 Tax=Morella rubra TaxID=262757 RepID=A0A6A1VH63_9ROSI|nr:hypothetical protein CJ030_MR5G001787 [Morella rubra]